MVFVKGRSSSVAQKMPGAKSMVVGWVLTSAVRASALRNEVRSSVVAGFLGVRNNVVLATASSRYAAHVSSALYG